MVYRTWVAEHNGLYFMIIEDKPEIGFYLKIANGERELYDYLQNTLEICKEQAFEDFGVPLESWKQGDDIIYPS